jgi:uncharacterized protein
MQHKCTVCGKIFENGSQEILNGCNCGNKRFYFIKNNQKKPIAQFIEYEDDDNNELIVFDLESVNIIETGKYEIDINNLMNKEALVYRYGEGKYSIDIEQNFSKIKQKR